MCMCIHVHVYVNTFVYIYVDIYTHIYVYVYIRICVCTNDYIKIMNIHVPMTIACITFISEGNATEMLHSK